MTFLIFFLLEKEKHYLTLVKKINVINNKKEINLKNKKF